LPDPRGTKEALDFYERTVSRLFRNTIRHHSGGLADLRPNEVFAILERGERIILRASIGGAGSMMRNLPISVSAEADGTSVVKKIRNHVQGSEFEHRIVKTVQKARTRRQLSVGRPALLLGEREKQRGSVGSACGGL
jgi:hypothetical protein